MLILLQDRGLPVRQATKPEPAIQISRSDLPIILKIKMSRDGSYDLGRLEQLVISLKPPVSFGLQATVNFHLTENNCLINSSIRRYF